MDRLVPDSPQRFVISHLNESDFKTGGLRNYSAYRDLGVAAATSGLAHAHVIRMIAPFSAEFSVRSSCLPNTKQSTILDRILLLKASQPAAPVEADNCRIALSRRVFFVKRTIQVPPNHAFNRTLSGGVLWRRRQRRLT